MADIRNSAQVNGGAESGLSLVERSCPGRVVLERAEELAQTGSWDWNLETDELLWSDNMFRLLGLKPGEVTPTPAYVAGRIHPDDRERVQRELDSAGNTELCPTSHIEFRGLMGRFTCCVPFRTPRWRAMVGHRGWLALSRT